MKVIIAGSRDITDSQVVGDAITGAIADGCEIREVVCGCAPGVDSIGREWAKDYCVPVKEFPADWDKHGRAAGPIRNVQMANYADALVLVWDGKSKGSASMKRAAQMLDLEIYETVVKK